MSATTTRSISQTLDSSQVGGGRAEQLLLVVRRIMDYWFANGLVPTTYISPSQLKRLVDDYQAEFGEWPDPVLFSVAVNPNANVNAKSLNAPNPNAITSTAPIDQKDKQTANQQIMTRVLLATEKVEYSSDADADAYISQLAVASPSPLSAAQAPTSKSNTTTSTGKLKIKKTGYDYLQSEYGEAARAILAGRPGLGRYLEINGGAEKVLSIVLAWCNHVLFREMGDRQGRYMSLGLDRFSREAGLTTRNVQVALKALQQAQLIETTLAGLELGQTEQTRRIPVPADELFALKADCLALSAEQGGGATGYLSPRCWQFHNTNTNSDQPSKSKATSNVFYILKKDVWESPLIRELRPFNPFSASARQYLSASAASLPSKGKGRAEGVAGQAEAREKDEAKGEISEGIREKDVATTSQLGNSNSLSEPSEKRTLPTSDLLVEKDVAATFSGRKGRYHLFFVGKYLKKDVVGEKRTCFANGGEVQRPHVYVSEYEHEDINTCPNPIPIKGQNTIGAFTALVSATQEQAQPAAAGAKEVATNWEKQGLGLTETSARNQLVSPNLIPTQKSANQLGIAPTLPLIGKTNLSNLPNQRGEVKSESGIRTNATTATGRAGALEVSAIASYPTVTKKEENADGESIVAGSVTSCAGMTLGETEAEKAEKVGNGNGDANFTSSPSPSSNTNINSNTTALNSTGSPSTSSPNATNVTNNSGTTSPTKRKQYSSQLNTIEHHNFELLKKAHGFFPKYSGAGLDWNVCVQLAQDHAPFVIAEAIEYVANLITSLDNAPRPIENPVAFFRRYLEKLPPTLVGGKVVSTEHATGTQSHVQTHPQGQNPTQARTVGAVAANQQPSPVTTDVVNNKSVCETATTNNNSQVTPELKSNSSASSNSNPSSTSKATSVQNSQLYINNSTNNTSSNITSTSTRPTNPTAFSNGKPQNGGAGAGRDIDSNRDRNNHPYSSANQPYPYSKNSGGNSNRNNSSSKNGNNYSSNAATTNGTGSSRHDLPYPTGRGYYGYVSNSSNAGAAAPAPNNSKPEQEKTKDQRTLKEK